MSSPVQMLWRFIIHIKIGSQELDINIRADTWRTRNDECSCIFLKVDWSDWFFSPTSGLYSTFRVALIYPNDEDLWMDYQLDWYNWGFFPTLACIMYLKSIVSYILIPFNSYFFTVDPIIFTDADAEVLFYDLMFVFGVAYFIRYLRRRVLKITPIRRNNKPHLIPHIKYTLIKNTKIVWKWFWSYFK